MSMGSKRKSAKYQARVYKHISNEYREPNPEPIHNTAYLCMTDEEIDAAYWNFGKADKTRMKKEAAKERARIAVQKVLLDEAYQALVDIDNLHPNYKFVENAIAKIEESQS